jgi:hypothetical protein
MLNILNAIITHVQTLLIILCVTIYLMQLNIIYFKIYMSIRSTPSVSIQRHGRKVWNILCLSDMWKRVVNFMLQMVLFLGKIPSIYWIMGWVDSRALLDMVIKRTVAWLFSQSYSFYWFTTTAVHYVPSRPQYVCHKLQLLYKHFIQDNNCKILK